MSLSSLLSPNNNNNNKATLYYMLESPSCRTVVAVIRLLGLGSDIIKLKPIDLSKKEQLKKDFIKVNNTY